MSSDHGLLIKFDPNKKRLVFLSVRQVDLALHDLKASAKEILDCEIYDLKQKGDDEAERAVGEIVLSYLDRKTKGGIGLRNYSTGNNEAEDAAFQSFLQTADPKNPEHQYL